ncbi:MAG: phosphatidate cytidylyltransferase [Phycisphaerales bacterium]
MLRTRLILGPFLILGVLLVVWGDQALEEGGFMPGLLLMPAFVIVGILAARELVAITRLRRIVASTWLTPAAVLLGLAVSGAIAGQGWIVGVLNLLPAVPDEDAAARLGGAVVATAAAVVLCASLAYYARHKSAEGVLAATSVTLFAFVYLGLMGGFLLLIRREHTAWMLLGVLLVTKSYDIGAFFVGRWLGRTKLIAWLSPGKTWEGFYGGLLLSLVVGALAALLGRASGVTPGLAWWHGALLGALFGAIGQGGDLIASLLKRDAGVKDASRALPGFGGVLDVIDSPLLVAPVAYWLLAAAAPGIPPATP